VISVQRPLNGAYAQLSFPGANKKQPLVVSTTFFLLFFIDILFIYKIMRHLPSHCPHITFRAHDNQFLPLPQLVSLQTPPHPNLLQRIHCPHITFRQSMFTLSPNLLAFNLYPPPFQLVTTSFTFSRSFVLAKKNNLDRDEIYKCNVYSLSGRIFKFNCLFFCLQA